MASQILTPKNVKSYDYGEFLGKIWREVHCHEGIVTIVICGKRGKGKSRTMCQLARVLDCGSNGVSRFSVDDVKFSVDEFLKSITGKYPIGKVHVLDDAGLHMYKSDALTAVLKNVNKVLQGIRYKHPIIMMSLPYFKQLVLDARSMSDIYIEMVGIDRKIKRAYGKIQILRVSPFTAELYRRNLLRKVIEFNPMSGINSEHWAETLYYFRRPPKEWDKEYSRRKKVELNKINAAIVEDTINNLFFGSSNNRVKKMSFSQAVEYVKAHISEVKDKHGRINTSKIMLLADDEARQLFSSSRAQQIRRALNG